MLFYTNEGDMLCLVDKHDDKISFKDFSTQNKLIKYESFEDDYSIFYATKDKRYLYVIDSDFVEQYESDIQECVVVFGIDYDLVLINNYNCLKSSDNLLDLHCIKYCLKES